jgi:hypothetical protein
MLLIRSGKPLRDAKSGKFLNGPQAVSAPRQSESRKDAPMKRNQPAVAIFWFAGLRIACVSAATLASTTFAFAADRSISETVTNAFETVVIDATKAAGKATAAAKEALASEPGKSGRAKKSKKDTGEKATGETSASPAEKPSKDKKSAAKSDAAKDQSASGTKTSETAKGTEPKKAGGKKDPSAKNDPAAKAADGNKPADPATGKAAEAPKKPAIPTEWPAVDVELARARCTQLLKGVDAVTMPEAPFRKGDCGTMAPVRLISIGKNPEVSLSPPPVVTCDMVVALTKWMKQDIQPLARRHLGSEVIRMESMSDYSCRMAYGRVGNKLSEHGKANALDIRGFTTRKGDEAIVLTSWGQTKRDVEKQIAAAKAAAAKAEAVKVAAEKANAERVAAAAAAAQPPATVDKLPRKTLAEGLPKTSDDLGMPVFVQTEGFGMAPTRLGGPKEAVAAKVELKTADGKKKSNKKDASKKDKADPETVAALPPETADQPAVAPAPKNPTSRFLHEAHATACQIFGTTLGPEANEAHRNHFHVDMAERKVRKICD